MYFLPAVIALNGEMGAILSANWNRFLSRRISGNKKSTRQITIEAVLQFGRTWMRARTIVFGNYTFDCWLIIHWKTKRALKWMCEEELNVNSTWRRRNEEERKLISKSISVHLCSSLLFRPNYKAIPAPPAKDRVIIIWISQLPRTREKFN